MAEKVLPDVKKDRSFKCERCGNTTTAKTHTAVCIGVDMGLAVELPDGELAVYKNGLNSKSDPITLSGRPVKIDAEGFVYSNGEFWDTESKAWSEWTGAIPGEHSPVEMKGA